MRIIMGEKPFTPKELIGYAFYLWVLIFMKWIGYGTIGTGIILVAWTPSLHHGGGLIAMGTLMVLVGKKILP